MFFFLEHPNSYALVKRIFRPIFSLLIPNARFCIQHMHANPLLRLEDNVWGITVTPRSGFRVTGSRWFQMDCFDFFFTISLSLTRSPVIISMPGNWPRYNPKYFVWFRKYGLAWQLKLLTQYFVNFSYFVSLWQLFCTGPTLQTHWIWIWIWTDSDYCRKWSNRNL